MSQNLSSSSTGRNLRVRDCLSNEKPVFISPDAPIMESLQKFKVNRCDMLIVSRDDKNIDGIVTDRDVAIRLADTANYENLRVSDAMNPDTATPVVVAKDEDFLWEIGHKMISAANVRRIPVVKEGLAIGVLSLADIANKDPELAGNILSSIRSHPNPLASSGSSLPFSV